MFNLFNRQPDEAAEQPVVPTASLVLDQKAARSTLNAQRAPRNKVATVQRMGEAAVATFTVTELTQETGVALLAELLDDLGETGAQHFVLDIQNVQFMDSACLGCLVAALNKLAKSGGKIALANTANSVQYLFKMTQLDRVFPIRNDVMAALAALERVPGEDD